MLKARVGGVAQMRGRFRLLRKRKKFWFHAYSVLKTSGQILLFSFLIHIDVYFGDGSA